MKAPAAEQRLDWAAIRTRLAGERGQHYWRSLEELVEANPNLGDEFPAGASDWGDDLSRRNFLRLAGASLALAGLTACTKQPAREILPYVEQPAGLVPGEPLYYATSIVQGGFATGLLVKSREGHPIKVDGNPQHPSSQGASSIWMQASLLELYDPDRSQAVAREGNPSTWGAFLADMHEALAGQEASRGAGLRVLTPTVTSPTLAAQLEALAKKFPASTWHQYEPVTRDNVREGARLAFGEIVEAQYRFEQASVIVALDADFLATHPERLRYTRAFSDRRRMQPLLSNGQTAPTMNRFYAVESTPSITGMMADYRLPLDSLAVETLAAWLAQRFAGGGEVADGDIPAAARGWLTAVARDLDRHRGQSLLIAGEWQPPRVHALAHWINDALGNSGKTVVYTESAEAQPMQQLESLQDLAAAIKGGTVEVLVMLGCNPAYNAPADLEFGSLVTQVKRSIHLGLEHDETAARCTWHIPQAHFLESWGDARAFDGTVTFCQPLIAPVYHGKTIYELLEVLIGRQPMRSDYEIVRNFWLEQKRWPDFEQGWRRAVHDGFVAGTESRRRPVHAQAQRLKGRAEIPQAFRAGATPVLAEKGGSAQTTASSEPPGREPVSGGLELELNFRPDANVWDGCFANNGWLQECPRPATKLTWDNAALISPRLAQSYSLQTEDLVELHLGERRLQVPVWVMPGQAEGAITLHLGYGRERSGRVGAGVGFNAYALRETGRLWFGPGLSLTKIPGRHALVATQTHHRIENPERQVYRTGTFAQFVSEPNFLRRQLEVPKAEETLYDQKEYPYAGYKWGMSIDLTTCIGCNACLVACEAENNIPVVGKDQVRRNREMFWIRVDTYYQGSLEAPEFHHMPVPCMHCEHAPCELVCPVEATVHDHEGLNLQVYNRCVGTRFCSNNCPYKVRRFNFFQYADYSATHLAPMHNPEVTVRWRGVMEKCTYCIQRINAARITAEKEGRRIRDGDVQTACQQACPAQAIVFGDLNDPGSVVARRKRHPLDYSMLGQLNTRPRTTYLAKVTNPPYENAARIGA